MPAQEYEHRFGVWLDNLEYVIAHNARGASYWLGMTPLADLTHQEYTAGALGFRADLAYKARRDRAAAVGAKPFRYEDTSPPAEMDWVKKGAVTKVKNQQQVRLSISPGGRGEGHLPAQEAPTTFREDVRALTSLAVRPRPSEFGVSRVHVLLCRGLAVSARTENTAGCSVTCGKLRPLRALPLLAAGFPWGFCQVQFDC